MQSSFSFSIIGKDLEVQFCEGKLKILDQTGKVCGQGIKRDRLFLLDCQVKIPKGQINFAEEVLISNAKVPVDLNLWHQRLGHVNELQLRETIKKGQICNVKISDNDLLKFCDGYVEAKMSRKPNKPVGEIQSEYPGQLFHSDLCGPMSESIGGSKYFVTFIDDFSRWVKISFLREKKEAMVKFKEFEAEVWNQ